MVTSDAINPLRRHESGRRKRRDSTTLSEGLERALQFNAESAAPDSMTILRRHLSVSSVVSTSSSFVERMIEAAKIRASQGDYYTVIGLGSCGSVFEIPGTELALKKGKDVRSLWKDFCLTNKVHKSNNDVRSMIQSAFPGYTIPRTPHCHFFYLPTNETYWTSALEKFPSSHREIGAVFQVDRILPLPQQIRTALIDTYFDEEKIYEAKNDDINKSCLVRVYLGENAQGTEDYENLLNFPMCLDMLQEIGYDVKVLADEMAIALAVCHWEAQVDAMDSEFVLGSATTSSLDKMQTFDLEDEPHNVEELDFTTRSIHLWLLDFDKANVIELTPEHVSKYLVPAFLGNDPYFPRPDVDKQLWDSFRKTYLKASELILQKKGSKSGAGGKIMELPELFLNNVAENIKENGDYDPEEESPCFYRNGSKRDIGRGVILNIGSANSYAGLPGKMAYTASKHAVLGITKCAAIDHAAQGIRINAVCPTWVRTPMAEESMKRNPGMEAMVEKLVPLKRMAEPEEVADVIVFLCSSAASYVTGTGILIDAGATLTVHMG